MTSPLANPVGFLQEFCQKHGTAFPNYTECGYSGPDHCREFSYQCTFAGQQVVAKGCQKKHAKTEAAKRMVELLEKNNYFESFDLDVATNKTDTSKSAASGSQSVQNLVAGPLKNPISMLQEYCQQKVFTLPHYSVSATSRIGGSFVCECSLGEFKTCGIDSTKKLAKIEAAAKMCEELQIVNISKLSETSLSPFNQNVKEEKFQPSEKNAISELQELCDFKKQPKPVYEDRAMFMGYFVVVCMMGSTQAEGRGVTKKGAKLNAAQKVLRQIQHNNMSKHVNRGQCISVVEADMDEVMDEHSGELGVAFAHCISGDFGEERQMSAGVAVIFKNKFGKPLASDFNSSHLTCQETINGATVYGLVTKSRYCHKPSMTDYDVAFEELTDDFKRKKLKQLICSPMGCVRDHIPIEHFAARITEFQRSTGAIIQIVTHDEHANRVLHNGLPYVDFVEQLQQSIALSAELVNWPSSTVILPPLDPLKQGSNGTLMDCTDSSSTISQLDNYSSSTISQLDFSIKSLLKNIGDSKSPIIEEYKFYKKENPTPILEEYNFDEEESPQTTQIPSASLSVEDSVVEIKPSSMPSKLISTSTIVESAIRVKDEPNLFSTPGISKINNGEEKSTHSEEQDTILMPFQTVKLENSDTKHETSTPEPKVSTFPKKESNYSEPVEDKATSPSSPLKKPQESASERAARIEVLLKKHLWNSESTTNLDPHLKSVFVPDRLDSTPETPHQNDKTNHTYSREFLLECAASKNSKTTPPNWDKIVKRSPSIINQKNSQKHPTSETLKVWAKNDQSGGYKL